MKYVYRVAGAIGGIAILCGITLPAHAGLFDFFQRKKPSEEVQKEAYDKAHLVSALTEQKRLLGLGIEALEERSSIAEKYAKRCDVFNMTFAVTGRGKTIDELGSCGEAEETRSRIERFNTLIDQVNTNIRELCPSSCGTPRSYVYFGSTHTTRPNKMAHEDVHMMANEVVWIRLVNNAISDASEFYLHALNDIGAQDEPIPDSDPIYSRARTSARIAEAVRRLYPDDGSSPSEGEEKAKARREFLAESGLESLEVVP